MDGMDEDDTYTPTEQERHQRPTRKPRHQDEHDEEPGKL
eukprot:CAMPEP_0184704794 /NCGR_PEP_ID=MMETSP0313-20130426/32334_1 /TAXON_ID=2792 /ORGANISM="Porphyridium aerugineum, Strain SAG 1380-2" /LENGTH=38 /DNA_ID= /DNA_START= /DNA_END= /DNA_ORIENTATION=